MRMLNIVLVFIFLYEQIGLMILYEALGRLLEPPEVHTERLLTVAVCGLIINVFGVVSFR